MNKLTRLVGLDAVSDISSRTAVTISKGPAGSEPIMSDCDIVFFSEGEAGDYSYVAGATPTSAETDLAYILLTS